MDSSPNKLRKDFIVITGVVKFLKLLQLKQSEIRRQAAQRLGKAVTFKSAVSAFQSAGVRKAHSQRKTSPREKWRKAFRKVSAATAFKNKAGRAHSKVREVKVNTFNNIVMDKTKDVLVWFYEQSVLKIRRIQLIIV